jgi:hypothetical protein
MRLQFSQGLLRFDQFIRPALLAPSEILNLLTEVRGTMEPASLVTDSNLSDSLWLRQIALDRPDLCPNRVAAGLGSHCLAFRLMLMKVYQPVVSLSRGNLWEVRIILIPLLGTVLRSQGLKPWSPNSPTDSLFC